MRVPATILIAAFGFVATSAAQPPTKKAAKPPAIEPEAVAALEKMGTFLREQNSFTVKTSAETDHALASGQKIRLTTTGTLRVKRPDHLRADVVSDRKQRQFFYDGKTFTMNAPVVGYYTSVPAPATILELAEQLEDRYGLELPLVDLFYWGTNKANVGQLQAATVVGQSTVDGVAVEQYAFRQPGLDWQIWIQKGDRPLPRKLVLTTTDDKVRPEYAVDLAWELGTSHEDSVFTFAPAKDSQKIPFAEVTVPHVADARGKTKRPL